MSLNPEGDESTFADDYYRVVTITDEKAKDSSRITYILPAAINPNASNVQLHRTDLSVSRYHALTNACYLNSILS